jgi:hypothetical protein
LVAVWAAERIAKSPVQSGTISHVHRRG